MTRLTIACLALLAASCAGMHGHDHEIEWVDYGDDPAMSPEFMNAQMRAGTPGEEHAELAKGVGHYAVSGRRWMAADQPPMEFQATSNVEMILDGHYLQESMRGQVMGMDFEGRMILGFDNLTGEYWNVWVDNTSTGRAVSTGHEREDGAIEMTGLMRDPLTPNGRPFRTVTSTEADGAFTMRMYDAMPDGGEFLVMELVYTRA
jgi:hypothetical protein